MRHKRSLTLLVAANVLLLAGLLVVGSGPRVALAQGIGLADNYIMVTGRIQEDFEALYLIDMKDRTLHTFTFRKGTRELEYCGYRMLEQDFRHNRS